MTDTAREGFTTATARVEMGCGGAHYIQYVQCVRSTVCMCSVCVGCVHRVHRVMALSAFDILLDKYYPAG
jgi:hypothetical protein